MTTRSNRNCDFNINYKTVTQIHKYKLTMEPPAAVEYAVLPVGVATMTPSP